MGGLGIAKAATDPASNPQSSLIDKLVSKFNLNKDDVQKVFDEEHASRDADQAQQMKDRLAQLVKDGKLTQEQADKLMAKATELKAQHDTNRDAMKGKTEAERKSAMETEREAMKKWLSDNGIPEEYIRTILGGGHGRGHGPGEMGPPPAAN